MAKAATAQQGGGGGGGSRAAKKRQKKKQKQDAPKPEANSETSIKRDNTQGAAKNGKRKASGLDQSDRSHEKNRENGKKKQKSLPQSAPSAPIKLEKAQNVIPQELLRMAEEIRNQKRGKKERRTEKEKGRYQVQFPDAQKTYIIDVPAGLPPQDALALVRKEMRDSRARSRMLFNWLIAPMKAEEFYNHFWEKRPLVIKRKCPSYYQDWFSSEQLWKIVEEHSLEYGRDLDVTEYKDEKRHTLNPEGGGTVDAKRVKEDYKKGRSVRFLRPQNYSDTLWALLSSLEPEWGSMAGANTYLTPAKSQGFAPHYDDIEAFILQVEGKKNWRIYGNMSDEDTLPRFSSPNLERKDLPKPMLEVTLSAGDLLYFPRGYVHEAKSSDKVHSLHVTVSCGQNNSWADLLEVVVPQALGSVIASDARFRRGLPRDYLDYMGLIHAEDDGEDPRREEFKSLLGSLCNRVAEEALQIIDPAADQMAVKFLHDRLPLVLTTREEDYSAEGSPLPKITVDTSVRVLRTGIARLTVEDGKAVLYHLMDNSREHHGNPLSPLEYELDDAEALEVLLTAYPEYVRVGDLPLPTNDDQVELVKSLYKEGILMLQPEEEEEDEEEDETGTDGEQEEDSGEEEGESDEEGDKGSESEGGEEEEESEVDD